MDLRSRRRQENTDLSGENIRSSLNANMSVNSEITAETSRAINSQFSTRMSRFEEIKSDLNSHILEVLNAAIEGKVLPTIRSAVGVSEGAKCTKWDLRSDDDIRICLVRCPRLMTMSQMDGSKIKLAK